MLLAAGALLEWGRMIQILLWIIGPVFLLAFIVTWIHHFRRKRKQTVSQENEFMLPAPESDGDGAHLLFDHTGLLRQYRNKLTYNLARYRALQQDFEQLQVKYIATAGAPGNSFFTLQTNNMEKTTGQWEETIRDMTTAFEHEKQQLQQRLEQLDKSYRNLESENELLVEQISMVAATGEEKEIFVNRWREENQVLKGKLSEQAWVHDLLEEKNRQIEFLQSQLEQRIKGFHQAEQGREELSARLLEKEKQLDQQTGELSEMQHRLREQQEEFSSRSNHIIFLENTFKELKDQNEMLNAEIADRRHEYSLLQQQREDEQQQLVNMRERLAANKQLLQHLHKEISACVEETAGPSQVVMMRPAYINPEQWEETAMP